MSVLSPQNTQFLRANILGLPENLPEEIISEGDIKAHMENDILTISTSQFMQWVESISLSIVSNPELWTLITQDLSLPDTDIIVQWDESGILSLNLIFSEAKDREKNTSLITLPYKKLWEGEQFFNIVQASFTDTSGEIYLLSSSGTKY